METNNPSQTRLLYNPQLQNSEMVEKLFVVRQKQFNLLLDSILKEKEDSIPQHHLIIGQRGMGKTTILKRMEVELHKKQYRQQFIPLLFREEQYRVQNLAEFWLNSLDALADSLEYEKGKEAAKNIDKTIQELSRKTPEMISDEAYKFLMKTCRNLNRRPVLLIDNIDIVFGGLSGNDKNKQEQWALRKLLSENGAPIIVSGGVTATDDVAKYQMPFYDFFKIQYLRKLSYEEFIELLNNLAKVTESNIRQNISRQKALHKLTGGNPRITVMLFDQISKGFSTNINDDLNILADAVTPLYKAKFEELSPQQRIILDVIALNWDAISLRKLAIETRMKNNQLSPQLIRLIDEGWIETTPAYEDKGNAYFISERFFNIYYLIRNCSRRHKDKIHCLSKFLECFYGKDELERISDVLLEQDICNSEQMQIHLAILKTDIDLDKKNKMEEKMLRVFSQDEELRKNFDFGEEFNCSKEIVNSDDEKKCALCSKGISLLKSGKYDEALNFFNKFIELQPQKECAWYWKGDCFRNMERYEEAIACYSKFIELDPNYENAWFWKGYCLEEMQCYEEAIACYDKSIELNPSNENFWYWKGNCFRNMHRYEEAIACYNKSIELNPSDNYAWKFKGDCFRNMHRYEEAIACYDKSIELYPNYKYAWFWKGHCLINIQHYEEAIDYFNKAIDLKLENASVWNNKGYVLVELKKNKEAIECFKKAIELEPNDLASKFHLLFLYIDKLNEMNKAIELFNEIENEINKNENKRFLEYYYLHKTLFGLHEHNQGIAKGYLLQAFEVLEKENKLAYIANDNWVAKFVAVVINLNYGSWLLEILEDKDYDIVLSPYYTAIKALVIEKENPQKGKKEAEIYLNNRAVEISDPAKEIVKNIQKYMD